MLSQRENTKNALATLAFMRPDRKAICWLAHPSAPRALFHFVLQQHPSSFHLVCGGAAELALLT